MEHPEGWAAAIYAGAAILLVLLNAFFVLAEFALIKVRATHIETLVRAGDPRARIVQDIHKRLDSYLSATQMGITIASLGLGWIGEPVFTAIFERLFEIPAAWSATVSHSAGLVVAFIFITFVHITIGELAPKFLAIRRPDTLALTVARPIRFVYYMLYPALMCLHVSSSFVLRLIGIDPKQTAELVHSEQELRLILGMAQNKGLFSFDRLLLFENLFDFGDLVVKNIMVPWDKAVVLHADHPWPENREIVTFTRLSRYPLLGAERQILGVVHLKDLMVGDPQIAINPDWVNIMRPALTVAPAERVDLLLRKFQQARQHLAVVMDQNKPVGIVTLEDVLEELVGSIEDEFERGPTYFLTEVMSPETIRLGVSAASIEEAVRSVIVALPSHVMKRVPPDAFEKVCAREQAMSSYLGEGICVPHARLDSLDRPVLLFGFSPGGIPLSGREEKAHFIFVLLTPSHLPHAQVRILARIAGMIQSEYVRERVRAARSPEEVMEVVRSADPTGVS